MARCGGRGAWCCCHRWSMTRATRLLPSVSCLASAGNALCGWVSVATEVFEYEGCLCAHLMRHLGPHSCQQASHLCACVQASIIAERCPWMPPQPAVPQPAQTAASNRAWAACPWALPSSSSSSRLERQTSMQQGNPAMAAGTVEPAPRRLLLHGETASCPMFPLEALDWMVVQAAVAAAAWRQMRTACRQWSWMTRATGWASVETGAAMARPAQLSRAGTTAPSAPSAARLCCAWWVTL